MKGVLCAGAAILLLLGCVYVQRMKSDLRHVRQEAAALKQGIQDAAASVDALRKEQQATNTLISKWAKDRAELDALRRELDQAVKEAIRNDPSYAEWRKTPLPDRLRRGLLDGVREAGNGTGASSGAH